MKWVLLIIGILFIVAVVWAVVSWFKDLKKDLDKL